ncbi:MAG: hypothetical protein LVQ63_01375 [Thermoplasmatales archaeon]|nr:hypothetical protein [Thermoplasmatales archaeon]
MKYPEKNRDGLLVPAILVTSVPAVATIAAIAVRNVLILDYDHVLLGAIWTGIDVFFGLIFRFVFKEVSRETRQTVAKRMLPATLFFLPAASILTPLVGYYLANIEGLWVTGNNIVNAVAVIAIVLAVTGYVTIFYPSILIAIEKESCDDGILKRRLSWICNGALAQAILQIGLISLMAYWVVFQ